MADAKKKGTIVLVHGAWSDGTIWKDVLLPLAHDGYSVQAAQIPLKSFESDVAAVELTLDHVEGPVLLVGHSYAGAVISAAGDHPKVKELAYVAALVPDAGESVGSVLAMHPSEAKMTIGPDASGFLWMDAEFGMNALGHDLHRGLIHFAVAVQKPVNYKIFEAKLSNPAWKRKPSSYLVATEDRILAPETQRVLAKRMNARVEEAAASHLVVLSQAEAVTQFIRNSAVSLNS